MRKRFISIALAALVAFAGLASAQAGRPGKGVTLEPAIAGWHDARPVRASFDQILEELGYTIDRPIMLDDPCFDTAVALGDVDVWTFGWFPLHNAQLPLTFFDTTSIAGTIIPAFAEALPDYRNGQPVLGFT